jgi:hypothetical protein
MPTFLEVRAAGVQGYLLRCPTLPYQRGGSKVVADLLDTALDRWLEAGLPAGLGVSRCDDGRRVSGRASLQIHAGEPDALAAEILSWAHRIAPGLPLEAVAGQGPNYLSARFTDMAGRLARGELVVAPPAAGEVPLLPRCGECGVFPTGPDSHRHDDKRVCADCAVRNRTAGYRTAGGAPPPAERDLLDAVCAHFPAAARPVVPADFGALAALAPAEDLRRNHLATVCADVNSLGRICRDLASGEHADLLPDLVTAVAGAMRAALHAATFAVQARVTARTTDDPVPLGVVPHWLGGDDLLASLAAPDGWLFAMALLAGFRDHLGAALGNRAALLPTVPSLSCALVFSHQSLPRSVVMRAAEEALDQAKLRSARLLREPLPRPMADPTGCTVTWTDLTQQTHYRKDPDFLDTWDLAELGVPTAGPVPAGRRLLDALAPLPAELRRRLALAGSAADASTACRRAGEPQAAAAVGSSAGTEPWALTRAALGAVHRWWRP